ncbi:glycosyltransferase family 39 protein [uncultured Corynebacterium sp.]|uniref:ArnT family glycosyltransferase n=1 Tax=uncultured Corynebacterium sp. TaxID=159447 RepID=UPI0025D4D415|nr:glycosyltransferase family 39 protein [uncultured Corynebacterium sp.]
MSILKGGGDHHSATTHEGHHRIRSRQRSTRQGETSGSVGIRSRVQGFPRGKELWGFIALLAASAFLFMWELDNNSYGNEFYAAASQAGSKNWTAFLFGSSDWGNTITVDKTPLSLWPSALAIKIFGLNSWSVLVPYAIIGVASVAVLWATVRRYVGSTAAFVAGIVLALTPVAVLMFRFNNPDAMLVFLMTCSVWAAMRCVETGKWRWAILTGAFVGLGFLAKQGEVLLIIPALVVLLMVVSPRSWLVRIGQSFAALAAMIVSAGWYILAVALWPSSSRPYIGGSTNNSIWELTLGYNGLNRLSGGGNGGPGGGGGNGPGGNSASDAAQSASSAASSGMGQSGATGQGENLPQGGSPGGGGHGGPTFSGDPSIFRLFNEQLGGQATWLFIAALIALVMGLVLCGRTSLKNTKRGLYIVLGVWLLACAGTFSFMEGIMHQYYTVAKVPPIAGLVGMGAADAWRYRDRLWVRGVSATAIVASGLTGFGVLRRVSDSFPAWLPWSILVATIIGALGWLVLPWLSAIGESRHSEGDSSSKTSARVRIYRVGVIGIVAAAMLAGPSAYSAYTIAHANTGSMASAGPKTDSGMGGPGGGGPGTGGSGGADGQDGTGSQSSDGQNGAGQGSGGADSSGANSSGHSLPDGQSGRPGGAQPGDGAGQSMPGGPNTGAVPGNSSDDKSGETPNGLGNGSASPGKQGGSSSPGGPGQMTVSETLKNKLKQNSSKYKWTAATIGSQSAASYQLSTDTDVMPIGGFSGSDDAPTLAQFKKLVSEKKIHYFIADSGQGGGPGGNNEITSWVKAHFTATTVDGVTVYDLTQDNG